MYHFITALLAVPVKPDFAASVVTPTEAVFEGITGVTVVPTFALKTEVPRIFQYCVE